MWWNRRRNGHSNWKLYVLIMRCLQQSFDDIIFHWRLTQTWVLLAAAAAVFVCVHFILLSTFHRFRFVFFRATLSHSVIDCIFLDSQNRFELLLIEYEQFKIAKSNALFKLFVKIIFVFRSFKNARTKKTTSIVHFIKLFYRQRCLSYWAME